MAEAIRVGDRVKLLGVPDWLIHDLPVDEQREILGFVGCTTHVTAIDVHGYPWIGFGETVEDESGARYGGHSLCIPVDMLERL